MTPNGTRTSVLFADDERMTFLHGEWLAILENAPFRLLFVDGGKAKEAAAGTVLGALAVGGVAVIDDLTPEAQWPEAWRDKVDRTRAFWLNDDRLCATEILTTPTTAAIFATRVA